MIAIPSSSVTSISRGAPDAQTDQRRITERDPRVVALRAVWRSRLTRSIGQLTRELRSLPAHATADATLTAFIHRHVGLLRAAYQDGHELGARDYYEGVSRHPQQWARTVASDERTERRRLAFYAPSVAKLAHEALLAWQADQAAATRVQASEAKHTHTGLMVAFFLSADTARQLALTGQYAEPANELHITLAYLGDNTAYSPQQVRELRKLLSGWASEQIPLSGRVTGVGRFPAKSPGTAEGSYPLYAAVDIPRIQKWRAALVKLLDASGFTVDKTFATYVPHITLAYLPEKAKAPVQDVPHATLALNRLWLAVGEQRYSFPIGDEQYPAALSEHITLADDPSALDQWQGSLGARLTLQADISWSGSQDGYVDAGAGDSIGLYSLLYWLLEPLAQHCFPTGTMIRVPGGEKPIEAIRVGDLVETLSGPRKVTRLFRSSYPDALTRVEVNGHRVACTSNHPFLTQRGWVEAGALRDGDQAVLAQEGGDFAACHIRLPNANDRVATGAQIGVLRAVPRLLLELTRRERRKTRMTVPVVPVGLDNQRADADVYDEAFLDNRRRLERHAELGEHLTQPLLQFAGLVTLDPPLCRMHLGADLGNLFRMRISPRSHLGHHLGALHRIALGHVFPRRLMYQAVARFIGKCHAKLASLATHRAYAEAQCTSHRFGSIRRIMLAKIGYLFGSPLRILTDMPTSAPCAVVTDGTEVYRAIADMPALRTHLELPLSVRRPLNFGYEEPIATRHSAKALAGLSARVLRREGETALFTDILFRHRDSPPSVSHQATTVYNFSVADVQHYIANGFVVHNCSDCPEYAANSPYNAPGLGGNTLDTAPGAGMTECGAACKCSLSYASPGEIEQPFWDTMFAAKQQEWIASGQQQPGPLPQVAGPARTDTAVTSPLPRRAPPTIPLEPLEPLTLPAEGVALSDEQKAALDLYRATALAWEEWRGNLPPLPKMFADLADDVMGTDPQVNAWLENMPDWTALSAKQQQLLGQVYEALADWALATMEAGPRDTLAPPPDATDTGDTTFAEWLAGRRLLFGYNPYRDAHGRFAPGPHAPHEDDASGGGHGGRLGHASSGHAGHAGGGGSGHVAHQLTQQEREAKAQGELDAARQRYQAALDGHRVANGELRAATAHETAMRAAHEDAKRAAEQDLRAQELQAARVREPARYAQYERFAQARANGFDQFRAISARVDVAAQHARDVRAGLVRRGIPQSVVTSHPEYLRAEKEWHDLAREGQVAWQSYRRAQSAMDAAADRLVGARVSEDRINAHPLVVSAHAVHEAAAQRVSELEATRHAFEREAIAADAAVQRAEGMLDVARGGSGVTIKYWQSRAGVSAQDAIRQTFGRDLTEHELAKLSGASIGDKLDIQPSAGQQGGISVSLRGPEIERRFSVVRDAQTGDIILHDEYTGNKGERTAGSGRDLIRGMENMRAVGVTRLYATAARGPALNGYYTWAKMGFVGDVPHGLKMAVQSQFGPGVRRVEQVMDSPGGSHWWKQFGTTWDAEFDFHPGSQSMRTFARWRTFIDRHEGNAQAGGQ